LQFNDELYIPVWQHAWQVIRKYIMKFTKLSPLDLVHMMSGSEVGPPCPSIIEQLLGNELSLLLLSASKELKLGLNGVKPLIGLEWFSCFYEGWWVGCQELRVSARGLTSSISGSMGRVELATSRHNNSVYSFLDSRMVAMTSAKVGGGGGLPFAREDSGSTLSL
jgi:hypothetical protein